jgi:hypothetical protein
MNALALSATEERIAQRIQPDDAKRVAIAGGITFTDAEQVMSFAKMMSLGGIALPEHLRGNVGACLAVCFQAVEWKMSPYAVANKSYSVNNRLAFESQLIQAVILQRAPIKGRLAYEYSGEGDKRRCTVSAVLADGTGTVEYQTPEFGRIGPKNSPLWKTDPDQQLAYFAGRSLCRRHFPDVLLGVYESEEMAAAQPIQPGPRGGTVKPLGERLAKLAEGPTIDHEDGPKPPVGEPPDDDAPPEPIDPEPEDDDDQATEAQRLREALEAKAHEGVRKLHRFKARLMPAQIALLGDEEWQQLEELAALADNPPRAEQDQ